MADTKITFFMMVTDPDLIIADYAVKSYAKVKGIPFKLRVYSNWVSSALKQKYFPRWKHLGYVDLVENEWQTDDKKPSDPRLDGPFELYDTLWDRELKKIDTPYHATVDADFEVLDGRFIPVMLERLDADPKLVAMSTDYAPTVKEQYDTYSKELICLNERWNTWFCIYKREALRCNVSHAYYQEIVDGRVRRNAWDSAAYFQRALQKDFGYKLAALDPKYQSCFIHYGAFSKNRQITEENVGRYRRLQIWQKRGLFGNANRVLRKIDNVFTKRLAHYLHRRAFQHVDRSQYWEGWGKR